MPEITVLMSVYNGERYLREAVDSILQQTLSDFIFLIIDDASTDSTAEILREYALRDSRIRIITNGKNLGLTVSLNKGLSQINTTYIARMDADDISLPERLEKQFDYMQKHPEIAALGCAITNVNEQGQAIGSLVPPVKHEKIYALLRTFGGGILHPTAFMRTIAISEVGGYRDSLRTAQDLDLWLRLSERHALSNLSKAFVCRRKHSDSVRSTRQLDQVIHHVLSVQAAERRSRGMPDPLTGATCDVALLQSLLEPGAGSAWLWLYFLIKRNVPNRTSYLDGAWQTALPALLSPPEGTNINFIWDCAHNCVYENVKASLPRGKTDFIDSGIKIAMLGYEINSLNTKLGSLEYQVNSLQAQLCSSVKEIIFLQDKINVVEDKIDKLSEHICIMNERGIFSVAMQDIRKLKQKIMKGLKQVSDAVFSSKNKLG